MNKTIIAAAVAGLALAPAIHADPLGGSATVSAYWQTPLGGKASLAEASSFGLRMDAARVDSAGVTSSAFTGNQTALLNVRYTRDGMQGLNILGINTLQTDKVLRADGSSTWWTVGAVVGGGALLMCMAHTLICEQGGGSGTYVAPALDR